MRTKVFLSVSDGRTSFKNLWKHWKRKGVCSMKNSERAVAAGTGRLTAAMYLRISSEDSDVRHSIKAESDSIASQRGLLKAFISHTPELENADILEFCDDGWSGKNFERPAVKAMLEQAKNGNIQCILVKDLSRFGRDYLEVGNYISRIFPFLGIRFIAVNDHLDSSRGPGADSLETSFKTLFHDIYSREISRKVREAKRFRAQRGEFMGSFAPYGYVRDPKNKKHLLPDPEAAEVVRRIFRMAGEKRDSTEIAGALNADSVPTPMRYKEDAGCTRTWLCVGEHNFWTRDTVNTILRDERYIGTNVFGRRMCDEIGKNHLVSIPRDEWIRVAGCHEVIVTEQEFAQAQANLREYKEYSKNGSRKRLLQKKVRCGVCGHIMYYISVKKPYYVCNTPRITDAFDCPDGRLMEEDLLDAVRDGLRTQALYAVDAARIWKERHSRKKSDAQGMRAELAELAESRTALESRTRELYEKFAFGEISREEYLSKKRAAAEKKDGISRRMGELEAGLRNAGSDGELENRFVESFGKYTETVELTADIIEDVLQEIIVYPDNVLNIVWNYQDDLEKLLLDIGIGRQDGKDTD